MINGLSNRDLVLQILKDYRQHFSREFVDMGLLEYRRRITELRELGYKIKAVKIEDMGRKRPGYQMEFGGSHDLFRAA